MNDDVQGVEAAILCLLENTGVQGTPMGYLVDRICNDGGDLEVTESAIWSLLQQQRLVVSGYLRRIVRQNDPSRGSVDRRTYEFVLALPETSH